MSDRARWRLFVEGRVQGVGFRPFVFRLASELALHGSVANTLQGAVIEVEGQASQLAAFAQRVVAELPLPGVVSGMTREAVSVVGEGGFHIRDSQPTGPQNAVILPDLATCDACVADIFAPANFRHRYPFTSCAQCGPRYTIIHALPYDRAATTMAPFTLCTRCRAQYEDPYDRRFHAETIACPTCGPTLTLLDRAGATRAQGDEALRRAVDLLHQGHIVALKGIGGFQLLVDATSAPAVAQLRARKRRPRKPLAVMVGTVAQARALAELSDAEAALLSTAARPIVLLRTRAQAALAEGVAPGLVDVGLMLPYSPLHHLLMHDFAAPLVATSGNRSGEPLCTDNNEALHRLADVADWFLVHNREIAQRADDSVAQVVAGSPMLLRGARGYAPAHLARPNRWPPVLAVGGQQKSTIALSQPAGLVLSPHIGDLDGVEAMTAFEQLIGDYRRIYGIQPALVAADDHPGYPSTRHAATLGLPMLTVQHHRAHGLACMAEHGLDFPVLAVVWDGTGQGPDGTVWGGEILRLSRQASHRVAHLRPFPLPGGELAVREPRRAALGLLQALAGRAAAEHPLMKTFAAADRAVLLHMMERRVESPLTSSAGRLFDAVAALMGLIEVNSYEGEGAVLLGALVERGRRDLSYPLALSRDEVTVIDWEPLIMALLADCQRRRPPAEMATAFHNGLVRAIAEVIAAQPQLPIVLGGGCFQNRYLCEETIQALTAAGHQVYWPQQVPPNDGGLAVGQLLGALEVLSAIEAQTAGNTSSEGSTDRD